MFISILMIKVPPRLFSPRYLAMPAAMFTIVMAVTFAARWQFLAILAASDKTRLAETRQQVGRPLIDLANEMVPPMDQFRYAAAAGEPPVIKEPEWKIRMPFAFDFGYARRVRQNGKESYIVEFIDSRDPEHANLRKGDDLFNDPERKAAVEKAKNDTAPSASPLIQVYGRRCVFFVSPAYRDVLRPKTPAEGEETLLGMAFATADPFMVYDLASKKFPELLEYRLQDEAEPDIREPHRRTLGFGVLGHTWKIFTQPRPSFYLEPQHRLPDLQLYAGLGLALVLAAWQWRQRVMLDSIIASRTEDLTKANERLESALAREQEVSEMKSNFISTVSHEFRTPLGVILSSNGILKNYLSRLSEDKRAEHFHAIGKAVSRMTEMVEDVLLFSRAEANRLDFVPRPMAPEAFCRLIVDEVRSATEEKCPLEIHGGSLPSEVMADEKLLRPILRNLLENAVKYSAAGSPVTLTLSAPQDRLVFEIADHGIGIPKASLDRLGEAFVRAANAENIKGTGLGLAIVQRCVRRHNGSMKVDSTEGQGTTVRIELPYVLPPSE